MFLQNRVTWNRTASYAVWQRWLISREALFIFSWTENFVLQRWQWSLAHKDHVEWWLVWLKRFYNFNNDWALEFSDSVGEGFETFATIDDLIEYYLENRIHLRNGHEVVLRSPLRVLRLDSQPPSSELWYATSEKHLNIIFFIFPKIFRHKFPLYRYHGTLLGSDAEQLVKEAQNSSFLVRESRTSLGNYALTVKVNDRVKHLKIYAEGNPRRFHLENDQQEFDCLESLVR